MKLFVLFITLCISQLNLMSQNYDLRIDSLNNEKKLLKEEIRVLDKKIAFLKALKEKSEPKVKNEEFIGEFSVRTKRLTVLYSESAVWSSKIAQIPKDLIFQGFLTPSGFYKINYDSLVGYLPKFDVETIEQYNLRLQEKRNAQLNRETILTTYGQDLGNFILNGKIKLGMDTQQVTHSWGKPIRINKTTSTYGTREQWIYPNTYLYFSNGKLTSIQESL